MSQLIQARNIQAFFAQKTYLTTSVSIGDTNLPVMNNNGAVSSWAFQVGDTGSEKAEIGTISAVGGGGGSVTVGSLRFNHAENTPVYWMKYNKLIIKRSTTGTAGTASALTNGTIPITPDSEYTQYDDTSGSTDYAYKTAYYNDALTATSPDSDWITPGGFPFYSLARIRDRARKRMKRKITDDELLDDWMNEWREELVLAAISVNKDYAMGTTDITFSVNQTEGTITVSDFYQPRLVEWISPSGTHPMNHIPFNQYNPNELWTDTDPIFYLRGDNIIGREPLASAGTVRVHYYSIGSQFENDSDELPYSLRPYTRSFIDYMCSNEADLDGGRDAEAALKLQRAEQGKARLISQLSSRNKSGNSQVRIVEGVL